MISDDLSVTILKSIGAATVEEYTEGRVLLAIAVCRSINRGSLSAKYKAILIYSLVLTALVAALPS